MFHVKSFILGVSGREKRPHWSQEKGPLVERKRPIGRRSFRGGRSPTGFRKFRRLEKEVAAQSALPNKYRSCPSCGSWASCRFVGIVPFAWIVPNVGIVPIVPIAGLAPMHRGEARLDAGMHTYLPKRLCLRRSTHRKKRCRPLLRSPKTGSGAGLRTLTRRMQRRGKSSPRCLAASRSWPSAHARKSVVVRICTKNRQNSRPCMANHTQFFVF